LIDDIDFLVTDRTADSVKGENLSLIDAFLDVIDGPNPTRNLKFFINTNLTNYKEKIDSDFLRRVDISIFLGNPSVEARECWID